MKCPYCNKETNIKEYRINEIKKLLKERILPCPVSIAILSKMFSMKRSTLVYYLNEMRIRGLIEMNRVNNGKTGRPTIISLLKK